MSEEIRYIDPNTGAQKGTKKAMFDLIPPKALFEIAEHYGVGAEKYAKHNFRKGYPWGLSFAACMRHLWAFWNGEDIDEETGSKHVISAAWHCIALSTFMDEHPELDDRFKFEPVKVSPETEEVEQKKLDAMAIYMLMQKHNITLEEVHKAEFDFGW